MYLLDTDHLVIAQRQSQPEFDRLNARLALHSSTDFFVSVISFHEQVLGWHTYISRAKDPAGVVRGYAKLQELLGNFAIAQVAPFDDAAAQIFAELRKQGVRIGTMDLRIAAIALSKNYTVLARNIVDFSRVPGLKVEDWTSP